MIFTRDIVTRENHWQITPLVTKKSLFTVTHALFFISAIVNIMDADGLATQWSILSFQYQEVIAKIQIDGSVQNCSSSIANALELLQSCTKPSKYTFMF